MLLYDLCGAMVNVAGAGVSVVHSGLETCILKLDTLM